MYSTRSICYDLTITDVVFTTNIIIIFFFFLFFALLYLVFLPGLPFTA